MKQGKKDTPQLETSLEPAYLQLQPELTALPSDDLLHVNLQVPAMVAGILSRMSGVQALRPQLATKCPDFDLKQLDKLEQYARCLMYAHARHMSMGRGPTTPASLSKKARDLRALLTSEARVLAARQLLEPHELDKLDQGVGFLQIASDLRLLVKLLSNAWPSIKTKCAIPLRDLEKAEKLASQLLRELDQRDESAEEILRAGETRRRAFTLTHRAYDALRTTILYIRKPYGDADKFAPSLYAKRGGRGRKKAE